MNAGEIEHQTVADLCRSAILRITMSMWSRTKIVSLVVQALRAPAIFELPKLPSKVIRRAVSN
jgi:hypothetical protein